MRDMSSLNRAIYSGYDFDSHTDELRARTQVLFASVFNDFAQSSLGILLLDHSAYALDTLTFYLDRRASDLLLPTARTRRAHVLHARQLGYKVRGAVASTADLQVQLKTAQLLPVVIQKGFQFQTADGTIFEAAEEVTFAPSETQKTIAVYEGETVTETFVSNGTENQRFVLRRIPTGKWIAGGSSCLVNGAQWSEATFLDYPASDQYEVTYAGSPPTLNFGDGIVGNIPDTGATILFTFVATKGKTGQVEAGAINKARATLTVNFQTVQLIVSNAEGSKGGDEPESLEEIRALAPAFWKTRGVAVTQSDYEALSGSYADPLAGRVAVARAVVAHSAESDLTLRTTLGLINTSVSEPLPVVTQAVQDATSSLDQCDDDLTSLGTDFTSIATKASGIDTDLQSAIAAARVTKTKTSDINAESSLITSNTTDVSSELSNIDSDVSAGKAFVNALTGGGSTTITTGDRAAIIAYFDSIQTSSGDIDTLRSKIVVENGNILSASSTIDSSTSSQITVMGQARDKAADIGLTVPSAGSLLQTAEGSRLSIVAELGTDGPPATGIRGDLQTISTVVQDVSTEVEGYTQDLYDHIDGILSADCKANLISVPILTRDAAGFYTSPTIALIRSLQEYLDARKEVTQVVRVISGEDYLVPAVIRCRISVLTGRSMQRVKATAEAAIDNALRDRAFGDSLYLKELYDALSVISGDVGFVNVEILGYDDGGTTLTSKLDADGNLIVDSIDIVTKGSVTVTTEVYFV